MPLSARATLACILTGICHKLRCHCYLLVLTEASPLGKAFRQEGRASDLGPFGNTW
jgi:hypothetical protein